jgi:prepilin signal peptidase PulO-like enzyme (type II secretory pathway)
MPIMAGFTAFLACLLLAISYVDTKEMRIPDGLSALLLVGGLTFWLVTARENLPTQSLSGAALASAMWLIRLGHSRITGRIGLGLGDIKMAGAGALWINPLLLPLFVFAASAGGLVYALFFARSDRGGRLPFAPFLAIGLFSCWVMEHYL